MTRNPIALAETLHLLSRSWRGAGFIGSGFEMLCIVNPLATALDETEGFWADLLSTHPPIRRRMNVLLAMARVSVSELDTKAARREKAKHAGTPSEKAAETKFFAMSPQQQWQGPFTAAELAGLPGCRRSPGSRGATGRQWTAHGKSRPSTRSSPPGWRRRKNAVELHLPFLPPVSRHRIIQRHPDISVPFLRRRARRERQDPRILARNDQPAADRVKALTRTALKENQARFAEHKLKRGHKSSLPLLPCPRCKNPLFRGFTASPI